MMKRAVTLGVVISLLNAIHEEQTVLRCVVVDCGFLILKRVFIIIIIIIIDRVIDEFVDILLRTKENFAST